MKVWVDANVILRLLTGEPEAMASSAQKVFQRAERGELTLQVSTMVAAEVVWVQEEPRNQGAWMFVRDKLQPMLDSTRRTLLYAGRPESASPAAGSYKRHNQEVAALIEDAFTTGTIRTRRYRVVAREQAPQS